MKIGIDGRLIEETGVGRYIRNLVNELGNLDRKNRYILFLREKSFNAFKIPNNRWEKRLADVPWHSISEQFIMPWILIKEHIDLVHVPYFNVPIFYPGKLIVTIHDLTILHFDTGKATTLPYIFYKLRRLGYIVSLAVGLRHAVKIITVSNTTKEEIIDHFGIDPGKIEVTYEGVDQKLVNQETRNKNKTRIIKDPYFLYVGNAYPHKNLETLIDAFNILISSKDSKTTNIRLVFVGKEDLFYRRIKEILINKKLTERVVLYGSADDEDLQVLYRDTIALVFPSFMEGFGLPAIEALAFRCPIICSDIKIFHEILGNHVYYFDVNSPQSLYERLVSLLYLSTTEKNKLLEGIPSLLNIYSWKKMATQTVSIYNSIA